MIVSIRPPHSHWSTPRALLHFTQQAVLSPLHCWCIQMFFSFSLKWFAFFNDLSVQLLLFLLSDVMFEFAQNPLSLTQGSPIRNTSVSEAPFHVISDWVKTPAHPALFLMYSYQPCPSTTLLNPRASTSDWLTITSCLFP